MSCQICKCYTPVIMCYVLYNYRSLNNTFFIYIVEPRFILRQQQERHRRKWTTSQSGKGKCMYVDFLIVLSYTICEQQGCKGNKIHILNQGSRDTTSDDAETKIQPCNLDEMTPNEQDLVKQQIEQIARQRGNTNIPSYCYWTRGTVIRDESQWLVGCDGYFGTNPRYANGNAR